MTDQPEPADPTAPTVGVGPHPLPWPEDPRLDPVLLAEGDRRNVIDRYRYWRMDAIVADLDETRTTLHVAIQNWEHDFNIGSIVRTANAFNVAAVHIVGRRRWNRRGAMVTDRYLHVHHHDDEAALFAWLAERVHRWDDWGGIAHRKGADALTSHLLSVVVGAGGLSR